MAASRDTIEEIIDVVEKYVAPNILLKIAEDLAEVPGNKSFRETVERILFRAQRRVVR